MHLGLKYCQMPLLLVSSKNYMYTYKLRYFIITLFVGSVICSVSARVVFRVGENCLKCLKLSIVMQNSIRKRQQELREKTLLSSLKSLFMQKYKILKPRTSEFVSIAPLYNATTKLQLSDLVCLISIEKHNW